MRKLVYLPEAQADFFSILEYIGHDDPARGLSFTNELQQQCEKLASLPGTLGVARPELLPNLRSFAYKDYIILFRYLENVFEVVSVVEGHRNIRRIFS